ncbi:uracil-DNA glycosylase [Candidatus Erwinia haradaeae]|uniref:Uracil-DNA glycosylase n=1 Tax=Candidatus Erwinia haradaeae TaxID=1922217 RepID=A0A451DA90_9GAMM|nr:uracil-DNA glycosylase [Candidatus Erwinia haradaeae]VFP83238.1 Uracil-DNA glycosylase [Candidatus Erwinia haradaeae]
MAHILSWKDVLAHEKKKYYFKQVLDKVYLEREGGKIIYPPAQFVFEVFRLTELYQVKVVILGQDPYHHPNQAHGLAFSVLPGVSTPPSLKNIYKELMRDIPGFQPPQHGCLESWAQQGVFLLNTILTVEAGKPHSHAKFGWSMFTNKVISIINEHCEKIVFLLWGVEAQRRVRLIHHRYHYVLSTVHPSPLSAYRGFFGCSHFSKTNKFLSCIGKNPINWTL